MADIFFSWDEVKSAVAGEWLLPAAGEGVSGVLDDSRSVRAGALFVAIVGELADGHHYLAAAARAGAAAVCVQRPPTCSAATPACSVACSTPCWKATAPWRLPG